ncbi:vitamin K epoxide reductase family protein [Nodosilinea nodulosa]|uniref:vitamin K epoxide reductase family protein n=1 Tax=Nodosilinea nodulosa TaxID=416001 RepID=UPI00030BFED4|nr:vitamin K epoxide reductase family protein [Nodosilinea nodulosa]
MPRKKKTAKTHRFVRPLMAALAMIGAVVTAYLTYNKLTGSTTACPTKGCDIVLSSPYAEVFGLPLALFGLLAYLGMAAMAIAPLLVSRPEQSDLRDKLTRWTQPLLFIGGTAMMFFSGYLMYLLTAEIKAVCLYCVGSALLSTSLFLLALLGQDWPDLSQPLFIGFITAFLVVVGTLGVYANVNAPATADSPSNQPGLEITTQSGPAEIALAQYLKDKGAIFYGAWWCPHCHEQKLLFGKEATEMLPYVECSTPDGQAQTDVCKEAGITGYPTWEINGERLSGAQPLEELAKTIGYTGPMNFQNSL